MRLHNTIRWLAAGILVSACGGGGDPPPTTNNTPVPASIQLTLSNTAPMNAIGDTRTLSISVRDASDAPITNAPVTFTSSSTAIATATGNATSGTITAAGNGTATITATSGSASAQVQVTVEQKLNSIAFQTTPVVMGSTVQLAPTARDSRNAIIAGVTGFTITSETPSVAVVSPTGVATGIAPGVANLTASVTRDGVTANASTTLSVTLPTSQAGAVTVTANTQSLFSPADVTVERGGTVNWTFQSLAHNVTFSSGGAPANITESANTTVSRTFSTVGTFPYSCTLHSGMNGTVTVTQNAFAAMMNGANERPTPSGATGTGAASFRRNGDVVNYIITFQGLTGTPTGVHLHGPAGANTTADILVEFSVAGVTSGTGVITGTFNVAAIRSVNGQPAMSLDEVLALMQSGNTYVNVHTAQFTNGEIRGQVAPP